MNAKAATAMLLVGLLVGAVAAYFGRQFVDPYLPNSIQERGTGITGVVVAKGVETDRLLITVAAQEGALLVTFRKRVAEIDLLVEEGDTVTLGIKTYRPFVEDPKLQAVRKPDFGASDRPQSDGSSSETDPKLQPRREPTPSPPAMVDSLPDFGTRR